jgi:membrane protein implicated in regulation of membrane protease activity
MVKNPRWHIVFFATLGVAAIPIAAVTSWWAFFTHQTWLGVLLLLASVIPAVISILMSNEQEAVTSEHGDRNYIQILNE